MQSAYRVLESINVESGCLYLIPVIDGEVFKGDVFHRTGLVHIRVLPYLDIPSGGADAVEDEITRRDVLYPFRRTAAPVVVRGGILADGETGPEVIFPGPALVLKDDAVLDKDIVDISGRIIAVPGFRADDYASCVVIPDQVVVDMDLAEVADRGCVEPYFEGYAVIVVPEETVLDLSIFRADEIDAVTVKFPSYDVDPVDEDSVIVVDAEVPAGAVNDADVLHGKVPENTFMVRICAEDYVSVTVLFSPVAELLSGKDSVTCNRTVVPPDPDRSVNDSAVIDVAGLSVRKADFSRIVFSRTEVSDSPAGVGWLVRVRTHREEEEVMLTVSAEFHADFPFFVGGKNKTDGAAVDGRNADIPRRGADRRVFGTTADLMDNDLNRALETVFENAVAHRVAKRPAVIPVIPDSGVTRSIRA